MVGRSRRRESTFNQAACESGGGNTVRDETNGPCLLRPQPSCRNVGTIVQFGRGREHTLVRILGQPGIRTSVEDHRGGRGRKSGELCNICQSNAFGRHTHSFRTARAPGQD